MYIRPNFLKPPAQLPPKTESFKTETVAHEGNDLHETNQLSRNKPSFDSPSLSHPDPNEPDPNSLYQQLIELGNQNLIGRSVSQNIVPPSTDAEEPPPTISTYTGPQGQEILDQIFYSDGSHTTYYYQGYSSGNNGLVRNTRAGSIHLGAPLQIDQTRTYRHK